MTPEGEFKSALRSAVNAMPGWYVWNQPAGIMRIRGAFLHCAPKGAADLTGIHSPSGRRVEIECKAPRRSVVKRVGEGKGVERTAEEPTPQDAEQSAWAVMVRAAGGIHLRARRSPDETIAEAVARAIAELVALV